MSCFKSLVSQNVYISPLGWPCIYSRCLTNWIMTRIYSHWMGFFIISIGFGNGFWKEQFIWDNLPSLLGDVQLAVTYHYFFFPL